MHAGTAGAAAGGQPGGGTGYGGNATWACGGGGGYSSVCRPRSSGFSVTATGGSSTGSANGSRTGSRGVSRGQGGYEPLLVTGVLQLYRHCLLLLCIAADVVPALLYCCTMYVHMAL
jgi:hypothetical protein